MLPSWVVAWLSRVVGVVTRVPTRLLGAQAMAKDECASFLKVFKRQARSFPPELACRVIMDLNSCVTECNATFSLLVMQSVAAAGKWCTSVVGPAPLDEAEALLSPVAPADDTSADSRCSIGGGAGGNAGAGARVMHATTSSASAFSFASCTPSSSALSLRPPIASPQAIDAVVRGGVVSMELVTNDWHMARSLMAYWSVLDRTMPTGFVLTAKPAFTPVSRLPEYHAIHLMDGCIQAARVKNYPHLWRRAQLAVPAALVVVARNMRWWVTHLAHAGISREASSSSRCEKLLRLILATEKHKHPPTVLEEVLRLCSHAYLTDGMPILHLPLAPKQDVGARALHYAAKCGSVHLCEAFLFHYGADPTCRDAHGLSAAAWAKRAGHARLSEWLAECVACFEEPVEEPVAGWSSRSLELLHELAPLASVSM